MTKVDWQMTAKHSVFVRYFITDFQHPPFYTDNLLSMSTDASAGLSDRVNTAVAGDTYMMGLPPSTRSAPASAGRA